MLPGTHLQISKYSSSKEKVDTEKGHCAGDSCAQVSNGISLDDTKRLSQDFQKAGR